MWVKSVRRLVSRAWDARPWRPEHARLLWSQLAHPNRNYTGGLTDRDHLMAATEWLCRAQDVMPDGGVCGRYSLHAGWTSSYPETTGYIIPTLLALAEEFRDDRFRQRAARAVRFLLSAQLPDGAFPAGEMRDNTVNPSVFNTAQILGGLTAWHRSTRDSQALQAADRAAAWIASVQGTDGAWRRHVYGGVVTTYTAHASCWLAGVRAYPGGRPHPGAALHQPGLAVGHPDSPNGWVRLAGLPADDPAAPPPVS